MDWTFPANGPLTADLELAAGSIEVDLAATDDVRVLLEPLGRDTDAAHEQIGAASVTCDGSRLNVNVPKRKLREVPLRLRVLVPERSAVRVRSASADVSCAGKMAAFEAKTSSGDITVRDDCDSANVSSASGDVRIAGVLGEVGIQTASGDVTARDVGGRTSVLTASGDIRLSSVAHDARLRTASGDVTIGCAYDGELSVNTASGDVLVGVGPGIGTWLDLITVSGDSKCTLSAEAEGENDASLRISCRTVSGDILVHAGQPSPGGGQRGGSDGGAEGGSGGGPSASGPGGSGPRPDPLDPMGIPSPPAFPGADDFPVPPAFPGADDFPRADDFPAASDFAGMGDAPFAGAYGFPGASGLAKLAGVADLGGLADLAGLGEIADLVMGRPTTGRGIRLPWRKP